VRLNHILISVLFLGAVATAADHAERRWAQHSDPIYPDVAKRMNLHGGVKLKVYISSDGSVRRVEYLGGHPLLAESAIRTVKTWRYEPGSQESTSVVEIKF
jgi:TonB family protein